MYPGIDTFLSLRISLNNGSNSWFIWSSVRVFEKSWKINLKAAFTCFFEAFS